MSEPIFKFFSGNEFGFHDKPDSDGINGCAEASDLGIPPGMLLRMFRIAGSVGNGQAFYLIDNNETRARYHQLNGTLQLDIIND